MSFSVFYSFVLSYRVVWFSGGYGTGKTLFASWLSYKIVADGFAYYIYANYPLDGAGVPISDVGRTVFVLDEGGVWLKSADVVDYLAFLRKFSSFVLVPSVIPPPKGFSYLMLQRVFDARLFYLPFFIYRYDLWHGAIKEKGYFMWRIPKRFFGVYDTRYVPTTDGGARGVLRAWVDYMKAEEVGECQRLPLYTLER